MIEQLKKAFNTFHLLLQNIWPFTPIVALLNQNPDMNKNLFALTRYFDGGKTSNFEILAHGEKVSDKESLSDN